MKSATAEHPAAAVRSAVPLAARNRRRVVETPPEPLGDPIGDTCS
jgi:hypothetical protein